MLYPVYLHIGDDSHAHGITIPDFPGCFSAADDWEELPHAIQEAAEVYFDGEVMAIPAPTPIEILAKDPTYEGGAWMLVDIDTSRLNPSGAAPVFQKLAGEEVQPVVGEETEKYGSDVERVEIALPIRILAKLDCYAHANKVTRSEALARAAEDFIAKKGTN